MPLPLVEEGEPLSVILKLPGATCNINCRYCYEKRKPYGSFQVITPELIRTFLTKAGGRPLVIELHGGEPLVVGKENMTRLLREFRNYNGKLRVVLQTNFVLLDQEWIDLFRREWPQIEFSTSLDGDPVSTQNRVDYLGRPTHAAVERALELIRLNGMTTGVICTVTQAALGRARDILDYFLQFGSSISLLKINPCFDFELGTVDSPLSTTSLSVPKWAVTPLEFGQFLIEMFDAWVETGAYAHIMVEPFLSIIRALAGQPNVFCVYSEQKCGHVLTLYPDGRVASCDELGMPNSILAHIDDFDRLDDIVHFATNRSLLRSLNEVLHKCEGCAYKATCRGGCLATRLRYKGSHYYEQYCLYRMMVIDHVQRRLDRLSFGERETP